MSPTTETSTVSANARPWPVLAIILTSYFMILLDNSVVFTGLPSIRADLDLSHTQLSWVQDAYTLVFGGLLLLGARAGDIVGRRRLFVVGLAVFGAASGLIGLAPSGGWIIAARALQGIGAAIVAPTSLALITAYFDGESRAKAISWYAATAGIGASLGLLVGGALTDLVSWRAAFLVNVPIAVAMIVGARTVLAETPRQPGRFDLAGAICATLGVGALVYGTIESAESGWRSAPVVVAFAVGAALLAGLVLNEARVLQPIMPLRLFASRVRSGAYAARMLYLGAMIGFFYFTTQLMQDALGFSPLQAGLGFLPMSLVNFAVAIAIPRLSRRISTPVLLAAGTATTLVGMAWLSRAGIYDQYLAAVAAPMALIGVGQGLAFAPLTSAGLAGVDSQDAGAASGVVNTAHQLGMALGLGILVTVSAHAGDDLIGPAAVAEQVRFALTGSSLLLAAALLVTLAVILRAPRSKGSSGRPAPARPRAPRRERRVRPDGSLTGRRTVLCGGLGTAALGLFTAACAAPRRKPLVAFFSRAGENYFNGGRIDLAVGNTAVVAGLVAELMEVDLYEIRASAPYPDDYEATVRRRHLRGQRYRPGRRRLHPGAWRHHHWRRPGSAW